MRVSVGVFLVGLATTTACGADTRSAAISPLAAASTHDAPSPVADLSPCEGGQVDLLVAFGDPRCVFDDEARGDALRADFETQRSSFVASASVLVDGRVEVCIRNTATTPLALPFFLSSSLEPFVVRAAGQGKVLQLRAASPRSAGGTATWKARTFARVVVAPGGAAFARLAIDSGVVDRGVSPTCPPEAKCSPETTERGPLPKGPWELEIELPIYGVRKVSAKVPWTVR